MLDLATDYAVALPTGASNVYCNRDDVRADCRYRLCRISQ